MGGPAKIEGEKKLHPETDNFQPVEFVVDGIKYFSPENYFQCQKSVGVSEEEFEATRRRYDLFHPNDSIHFILLFIFSGSGMGAWLAGSNVKLRPDWEIIKVRVMYTGNRAKFEQHPDLAASLVSTRNAKISFSNSTPFWYT